MKQFKVPKKFILNICSVSSIEKIFFELGLFVPAFNKTISGIPYFFIVLFT